MSQVKVESASQTTWEKLVEGWNALREKAAHALTHFTPSETSQEVSQRWALVAADITEHKHSISVEMELPGMEKNDITLNLRGNQLVISGEKRSDSTRHEGTLVITERAFGSFKRVLSLPCNVSDQGAKAKYRKGVLKITLSKSSKENVSTIPRLDK